MSTLATIEAINDALALASTLNGLLQAAQKAGREVTPEELDAARAGAIAAAAEAREAAQKAQEAGR